MAIDFSKKKEEPKAATPPQDVAVVEPKTVITPLAPVKGGVTGVVDSSDKLKPYLGVAQGVGFGPEYGWRPGDVVLGKEYGVYRPANPQIGEKGTDPIRFIVVSAFKNFIERLPQNSPDAPRTFLKIEDAKAAGLRSEWLDTGDRAKDKPTVEPQLNVCALIARPALVFNQGKEKANCPFFNFELNDEVWAPVLWSISGSASYPAAKAIITFTEKKATYSLEMWLTTKLTVGANTYASPIVKAGPALPAGVLSAIEDQLETI